MTIHRIYSLTSIGRPVDVKYPTNKYMLISLAPAAALAAAAGFWQGAAAPPVVIYTLSTIFAAFGAWALGRELAPDAQGAAFVALALAVMVMLFVGPSAANYGLLVLFTVLGLVRQVNRTTGLAARVTDSVVLTLLTVWVVYSTANPLFGAVALASFALDGSLSKPQRRQWLFALVCLGVVVVYMVDHDSTPALFSASVTLTQWTAALIAVIFALNLLLTRKIESVGDVNRKKLDPARVRGGMLVALLGIVVGLPQIQDVSLITAATAGVCLAAAFSRSFSTPV